MSYLKIGKDTNSFVVYRVIEFKGKMTIKAYYYSNNFSDCINYCKRSKYELRGFIV